LNYESLLSTIPYALKVLSETEKQLRTSRNKATWVTVALLQFGTNESDLVAETNDIHAHSATGYTGQYNQIYYLYWSPTEWYNISDIMCR
jgi:hypothetical protein